MKSVWHVSYVILILSDDLCSINLYHIASDAIDMHWNAGVIVSHLTKISEKMDNAFLHVIPHAFEFENITNQCFSWFEVKSPVKHNDQNVL